MLSERKPHKYLRKCLPGSFEMPVKKNILLITMLASSAVSSAETFEVNYQAPNSGVTLRFSAPQKTTTPLLAEIYVDREWKVAAILGEGLYRTGRFIVVENPKVAANPKAKRLPSSVDVLVSPDKEVAVQVRSHAEVVSGSPLSSYTLRTCFAPLRFTPDEGRVYEARWIKTSEECGLSLRSRDASAEDVDANYTVESNLPVPSAQEL